MVPFKNRLNSSARSSIRGSFNHLTVAGGGLRKVAVAGFAAVIRGLERSSPPPYLIGILFEDVAQL
jgi:hypothetical protein